MDVRVETCRGMMKHQLQPAARQAAAFVPPWCKCHIWFPCTLLSKLLTRNFITGDDQWWKSQTLQDSDLHLMSTANSPNVKLYPSRSSEGNVKVSKRFPFIKPARSLLPVTWDQKSLAGDMWTKHMATKSPKLWRFKFITLWYLVILCFDLKGSVSRSTSLCGFRMVSYQIRLLVLAILRANREASPRKDHHSIIYNASEVARSHFLDYNDHHL
jgi:hypothetical protein